MKTLTILSPVYNEVEALPIFINTVKPVLAELDLECDFLFIDDGSTDGTLQSLQHLANTDNKIKYISLSRNFGKEAALLCGLKNITTDAVIPMDIDLQDPPALIPQFVKKWEEGYDMVLGVRENRSSDTFLKRFFATAFYKIHNFFATRPLPENTGDFRLMDKKVISALSQINESTLFMKGLFNWVGFKTCKVGYIRPQRSAGQTKWSYWKLWNFALDGIFNSSTLPLRLWAYFGIIISGISFIYAVWIIAKVLIYGKDTPGYASLAVLILFFGGIQLISIGVLGEYIGRIFSETKKRPIFIIKETNLKL